MNSPFLATWQINEGEKIFLRSRIFVLQKTSTPSLPALSNLPQKRALQKRTFSRLGPP